MRRPALLAALGALALAGSEVRAESCCPECVIVALDLDPARPGFQTSLEVAPGTRWVRGVGIWIFDPAGAAPLHSVGYLGGLNRGIAFGHVPHADPHAGAVASITATALHPVVAGHDAFVDGGTEPFFAGPELQYFEFGGFGAPPGTIPSSPGSPVLTLDIELADATAGDVYRLQLGDKTAQWLLGGSGVGGAFSSSDVNTLEAGGDACPDGTLALSGTDPDSGAPAPPAPYRVDYRDGPAPGGATIVVVGGVPVPRLALALLLVASAGIAIFARLGEGPCTG